MLAVSLIPFAQANKLNSKAPKIPLTKLALLRGLMGSIAWPKNATSEKIAPLLETTFRATCPATTTSMSTAVGVTNPSTGTSGIPPICRPTGPPTVMAPGTGLILGVGVGSAMSLGVLHLTITAAGPTSVARGVGARDHSLVLRSTDPRSLVSLAEAGVGVLVSASEPAGSRWVGANRSSRGSGAAATSSL